MPKPLPSTDLPPLIRTDFTEGDAWSGITRSIEDPSAEFRAEVAFVDDPAFDGLSPEELVARAPAEPEYACLFVVDEQTLAAPDHPILVVDPHDEALPRFRVVVSQLWGVENNLTLANMDFDEFAEAVDADGVFRGFPDV